MGKRSREKRERWLAEETAIGSSNNYLERICLAVIECGAYLAMFTPLVLAKSFFFPFVSPKTIFFRIVVEVIFIAYALLVALNRRYLPRINALTISIILFLAIVVLASLTGVDFAKSFWSTFERMTGILTLLHLFIFFIVLSSVFKERKYWERTLAVSILVGATVSLELFLSNDPTNRGGVSLGNSSFMAAYLLFDAFFAIILFFTKNWLWKIFSGILGGLIIYAIVFNPIDSTRGATGGLVLGVLGLCIGYMIFSKNRLLVRLVPVVVIVMGLLIAGLTQTDVFKKRMADLKHFPDLSRSIVWREGWQAWQERPLLGWGLENFNVPFAKYFNPELPPTGDVWYDRVHNVIIDTLASSGILGLLSYLAVFGVAIVGLLKICSKVAERKNVVFPLGLAALLIGYFAQNLFVFDMISTYMTLFLSLAFINFLITPPAPSAIPGGRGKYSFLIATPLIVAAVLGIYFGNVQPVRASRFIVLGTASSSLGETIADFEKALAASPMAVVEAPEQFARKIDAYVSDPGRQDRATLENGFALATEAMKKSLDKNPQDYRNYLVLGRHYNSLYQLNGQADQLNLAESVIKKAIALSPQNQQGYWALAQTEFFEGKNSEAIDMLRRAVDLNPQYGLAHWYLVLGYKITDQNELASGELKEAEKAGYNWRSSLDDLKKVIEIYQKLKDSSSLMDIYPLAIEKDAKDPRLWAGLAIVQANLGKFKEARESAQKALDLKPDFASQVEQFLRELPE